MYPDGSTKSGVQRTRARSHGSSWIPEPAEVGRARDVLPERLDLDVEPDRRELLLQQQCVLPRQGEVGDVEDGLAAARIAVRERFRLRQVASERVDEPVQVARHGLRDVLIGPAAGGRDLCQRGPVEREVDRQPQLRVVAEQGARRVEHVHPKREAGVEEEPLLVVAVLLQEAPFPLEVDSGQRVPPVRLAGLDPVEHLLGRVGAEIDVEAVDVVCTRAAVEAVAAELHPSAGDVLLDVVGTGSGEPSHALRVGREGRRDRAEERHRRPGGEAADLLREPDDERAVAGRDPGWPGRPAGQDVVGADDRLRVAERRRPDAGRERAGDRLGERVGADGAAVAEAEALAKREGVRACRRPRPSGSPSPPRG